jgi:hypothetical protein
METGHNDDGAQLPQVKCPFCPKCGTAPPWIFDSMAQAFCINEECDVLCWTPWDTAAQNLADMHEAIWHESEEKEK